MQYSSSRYRYESTRGYRMDVPKVIKRNTREGNYPREGKDKKYIRERTQHATTTLNYYVHRKYFITVLIHMVSWHYCLAVS